jgi:curved DNA-binding protein CbpA
MDPYRILNLSSDASLKEIKKAFHTLSLRCHPDKAGESSTLLFQHVNAAFQMLKPGDFDQQKKSSAAYMRQQTDFDNYTTAELYEDILRDFEKARAAYERAEQRRSSSEQWGGDSDNEYSGDEYRIPHEEKKGEDCPVCKECPCRLFNTEEKPAVNHNESPTCDKNKPPPKRDVSFLEIKISRGARKYKIPKTRKREPQPKDSPSQDCQPYSRL